MEKQLRRYFAEAERLPGLAGENLLKLLEMRLDNVVYRLGFADSRRQARQFVRHAHFTLNGHKANIPSCLVKPGDVIAWKVGEESLFPYQNAAQNIESKQIPRWLSVDKETLRGRVLAEPSPDDIEAAINERLIVEYYSR
jgi:small subunit ribosomal protein S4